MPGKFKKLKVFGLDLAGKPARQTGYCILSKNKEIETKTGIFHSDKEILQLIKAEKPVLISIDAPLSKPLKGGTRQAEKELRKKGLHAFPPLIPTMKPLTLRGIKLKKKLKKKRFRVIETFPGAVKKLLGLPGKKKKKELVRAMEKAGFKLRERISGHELDAFTCALMAKLFLEGKTYSIGSKVEGQIMLPKTGVRI